MVTHKGASRRSPADPQKKGDPAPNELTLDLNTPPVLTDPSTEPSGPGGIDLQQLERHHRVTRAGWVTGRIINTFIWAAVAVFAGAWPVIAAGVWIDFQAAEAAGAALDLSNTVRLVGLYLDLVKGAAEVLWMLFGPLLAFVFGYYFRRERS